MRNNSQKGAPCRAHHVRRFPLAPLALLSALSCGRADDGNPEFGVSEDGSSPEETDASAGGDAPAFAPDDSPISLFPDASLPEAEPPPVTFEAGPHGCPIYSKLCGGSCYPVSSDPDNCGDCGKRCAATETCSAGQCVPAAQGCVPAPQGGDPALKICGRSCVDPLNDSRNCGRCGNVCPSSQGCVNGACVGVVPVSGTAPSCDVCMRDLAKTTFRWALCTCGDAALTQKLYTDAYDSTKGPYPPNPLEVGGAVGVNGNFSSAGAPVDVAGALWCAGANGVTTRANSTVSQEM